MDFSQLNNLTVPTLDANLGINSNTIADFNFLTGKPRTELSALNGLGNNSNGLSPGASTGMSGLDMFKSGIGLFNALATAFLGSEQLGLAKKQYKSQIEMYNNNLANSQQSYNNRLEDRNQARAGEGTGIELTQSQLDAQKLNRNGIGG